MSCSLALRPRLSLYREGRRGCYYGSIRFRLRVLVPITKPSRSLNPTGSAYFPMESELSCVPSSMSGRGPIRGLNYVGKEPYWSCIDMIDLQESSRFFRSCRVEVEPVRVLLEGKP
jgi:hypothetical protein